MTFSDGTNARHGAGLAGTADLSTLADGPISSVLNVTDDAGNTASANGVSIDLDTSADLGARPGAVDHRHHHQQCREDRGCLHGFRHRHRRRRRGGNGDLLRRHHTTSRCWPRPGTADLSTLADGPISSVLNVTDDAGNTASANGVSIDLDTSADLGAPLALSITDTTINNAEKTAVAFTVSGIDTDVAGAAATVTFSDGTNHVTVLASAGTADLSTLV